VARQLLFNRRKADAMNQRNFLIIASLPHE
jgi:hypothetical protein